MATNRQRSSHGTGMRDTSRPPLRVLSLDGGGVRGLSSLLILRRIMYNIKPDDNLYKIARPCDIFDMICGTSTGGLIAIMLGRLRMGIQEAIDAYLELAQDVFQEGTRSHILPKFLGALMGKHRFSGEKLAKAVKHLARTKTGRPDTAFFDAQEDQCRVFVCATRTANSEPAILRSYRSREEDSAQGTIWEVARATSAAPTFFPPISFGRPLAEYVDGAMVHNNPIRLLMRELHKVWGADIPLSCVLSIGTGNPAITRLNSPGLPILMACAKLATDAEEIARNFKADQGGKLQREGKYFRFNVAQGLENVKLEEWKSFDLMEAATIRYLSDSEMDVDNCCVKLKKRLETEPVSPIEQNKSHSPEFIDITRVSRRYFTGRAQVLKEVESYFCAARRTTSQVAVFIGLGGIGKTQIALRYFERRRTVYPIALFIECNTKQESIAAFVRFAHLVVDEELRQTPESTYVEVVRKLGFACLLDEQGHVQSSGEGQVRVVDAVKRWLGRQTKAFLIIFDNADDPAAVNLNDLMPPSSRNGDIIITTRDTGAKAFGQPFFIEEMQHDEAVDLLSRASEINFNTQELWDTAAEITKVLGYLPLAIDQAGGYLANSDSPLADFFPTYSYHAKSVLSALPSDGFLGYKHSALTTWEMSFERLLVLSRKAASLLQILGFVNNSDICEPLYNTSNLAKKTSTLPYFMGASSEWSLQDGYNFNEIFTILWKLCLIRRNGRTPSTHIYDIHPVVHVWIRERLDPQQQALYAREALLLVARALPSLQQTDTKAWAIHRRLYPHVQACWEYIKKYSPPSDDNLAILDALDIVATSFRQQGNYQIAEDIFLRVYQGNRLEHGPLVLKTLDSALNLASIYDVRGSLRESEDLYELVFEGFTKVLGLGNRKTLAVLQSLASVMKYRGKAEEAEQHYKQALEGRQNNFGEEDPDTLETMDALASLYYASSRPEEAEPLRLFVLNTRQKLLGDDNLETLGTVLDMGMLYSGLGKNDLTVQLFEKAYQHRKALLQSPESEKALNALSMIAAYYANLGQTERAEALYRNVLEKQLNLLGDLHLDTIWTQCCLGTVLFMKHRSAESVKQVEKALEDIESKLGPDHLDTLWVAHALAIVYECWDKRDEAEMLLERVVKGFLHELGQNHLNTLYMINDLGDCYSRGKKPEKAAKNFRIAYEGKLNSFGFKSPHTLYTATLLASTMKEIGEEKEAEQLFKKVLETTIDLLGAEHSDADICMMYLADLYVGQQRFPEARDLYQKVYDTRVKMQGRDHSNTRHAEELLDKMNRYINFPDAPRQIATNQQAMEAKLEPRQVSFRPRRVRSMRWYH